MVLPPARLAGSLRRWPRDCADRCGAAIRPTTPRSNPYSRGQWGEGGVNRGHEANGLLNGVLLKIKLYLGSSRDHRIFNLFEFALCLSEAGCSVWGSERCQ